MKQSINTQRQARRRQEDAILNRILIWVGGAVAAEVILLLVNRLAPQFVPGRWLSVLVPVAALLALIYYLFQRDFFCITLICAGGIAALQFYRKQIQDHPFRVQAAFALAFVLLIAAVVCALLLHRAGGLLPGGRRLLPKDANYPLLHAACALDAALLILTLLLGSSAAYYLLFVLVGWLFVMAVYYTVRLM